MDVEVVNRCVLAHSQAPNFQSNGRQLIEKIGVPEVLVSTFLIEYLSLWTHVYEHALLNQLTLQRSRSYLG